MKNLNPVNAIHNILKVVIELALGLFWGEVFYKERIAETEADIILLYR